MTKHKKRHPSAETFTENEEKDKVFAPLDHEFGDRDRDELKRLGYTDEGLTNPFEEEAEMTLPEDLKTDF